MLITDQMAETAFDWLRDNADRSAHAKAMRVKAEYATKMAKARAFLAADGTVAEREAKALLNDEVRAAIKAEVAAVEADEAQRNHAHKCNVLIEGWRTESANARNLVRQAA